MKRIVSLSAVLLFGALAVTGGSVQAEAERDIVVSVDKIKSKKKGDLKVELWSPHDDHTYRIGDEISFSFRTNQKAYVTVLSVGTSGRITILFPNRWQRKNQVKANKTYTVPPKDAKYNFQVQGPTGTEVIKVLATKEPHDFGDAIREAGDFYEPTSSPRDFVERDIVPVLDKHSDDSWSEDSLRVRILRGNRHQDDDEDEDEDEGRKRYRDE